MNHFVQCLDITPRNGAASSPSFRTYFGQNGQGAERMAAAQLERPFKRQLYLQAERRVVADTTLPASRRKAAARRVEGFLRAAAGTRSDFDLLRDLQGIVDLDTEVPDCRFQPMPEKSSHDSPEQSPSKSHQGGCDVVTLLRTTPFAALPHRTSGIRLFCQELSEPKRTPQSR